MSATAARAINAQECDWECQDAFDRSIDDHHQVIHILAPRLPYVETGEVVRAIKTTDIASRRLDVALEGMPGVRLFRRANSFTAHPTTQGLSMRGVGGNAAGRALVTLDGVPLNDPFGGWIYWATLPEDTLDLIRVHGGGTPGAFGSQALVGALELETNSKLTHRGQIAIGADQFRRISGASGFMVGRSVVKFDAGFEQTDGDFMLAEPDRGTVDTRASSEVKRFGISGERYIGQTRAVLGLRYFDEGRTSGLSLADNSTEALDASIRLVHDAPRGTDWEVVAYYRDRQFENVFASALDDRTTERAVLDQFDVPAWGAGVLARVQFDGFELGMDGRRMSGETNERFRDLGAGFTRQRRAGGDQWTLGFYGEYSHDADWGALSATLRYDRWRTYNGVRDEFNIEDGFPGFASPDRSDVVPDRKGGEWTGRVGFERALTGAIDMRAAAYKTWRLPTLNEYYRPFRVVNDITEANPALTPETLYGAEIGFDYEPLNTVKLSATYYRNWLKDGVGNVTIGFGPGFFRLGGFVPAGGVLRQRANVDESITDGIELDAELVLETNWTLSASYLYAHARITKFDAMPGLVGKWPVQTPRHAAAVRAAYDGEDWDLTLEGRYAGGQYDDDQNTRRLDAIFTVNAGVRHDISDRVTLSAQLENLFDAKVVSAVTADGLETLAQRRFWRIGLEANF